MARTAVCIDFGSTFTKVAAVDVADGRLLAAGRVPSTVKTDGNIGLDQCFELAEQALGKKNFTTARKLATSSAAGGLRMAVVGLAPTLSLQAGKSAACGAGAKIIATRCGCLTPQDGADLAAANVELVLLCGGYEGGSVRTIIHNAEILANSALSVPIVYGGNSDAAYHVRATLTLAGKECFLAHNIIPDVGQLHCDEAEAIIRSVFLSRIIAMKGLANVAHRFDAGITPTPAAVLTAGDLLARGTRDEKGLGELMLVDVGGATTDVYSFGGEQTNRKTIGAAEPFAKRTVEGDLGLRESSSMLLEAATAAALAEDSGLSREIILSGVQQRVADNHFLATDKTQQKLDLALARGCARLAARRHSGRLERVLDAGVHAVQRGKDLTSFTTVIGTGGPIIHSGNPDSVLRAVFRRPNESNVLLPECAQTLTDNEYVLFAAGLLSAKEPIAALKLMKASLHLP